MWWEWGTTLGVAVPLEPDASGLRGCDSRDPPSRFTSPTFRQRSQQPRADRYGILGTAAIVGSLGSETPGARREG